MDEVPATMWSVVIQFVVCLLGIGTALFGMYQIGGSAGIQLGGYRAAQSNSVYGQHILADVITNDTGHDLTQMGSTSWSADSAGRTMQGQLTYDPGLGWMGIRINGKVGTTGRVEQFYPDRPQKFE